MARKKMETVQCDRHGQQQLTRVCQHIAQTVRDGQPRGFYWSGGAPNDRGDAWCAECDRHLEAAGGEWTAENQQLANVQVVCGLCYDQARSANGF